MIKTVVREIKKHDEIRSKQLYTQFILIKLLQKIQMQQSYLSNDSQREQQQQNSQIMAEPQKKMYGLQLPFMLNFKKEMELIQQGIQSVLKALTNYQQGQKKRLPYNVLKSFQKNLKQLRKLRQKIIEENKRYEQNLLNREKQKQHKNSLFKQYLKQLGGKRQELKNLLSDVETRVRKLEDSGYAQFVQYDVVVPEINTIRFPFSAKRLLSFVISRHELCEKITIQINRRKNIEKKYFGLKTIKEQKQEIQTKSTQSENKQKRQEPKCEYTKLPIATDPNITLRQALNLYKTYKYYLDERVIAQRMMKMKLRKNQYNISIQKLKSAIKLAEQHLYKTKLQIGFKHSGKDFTKTDCLIYFKQMKGQIKQKVDTKIFYISQIKNRWRSKSANHKQKVQETQ